MLDYRHLGRVLAGSKNLQRWMERTRTTGGNKRLWSDAEIAALKRCYPDYDEAMKALPGRGYRSIRAKAKEIGIGRRVHTWSAAEVSRLKKLSAAGATNKEIFAAFPEMREQQILGALATHRIRRPRRKFKQTGHTLLDALRDHCHEHGISMVDLDGFARTRKYFARQMWNTDGKVRTELVAKAIDALGGILSVTWPD